MEQVKEYYLWKEPHKHPTQVVKDMISKNDREASYRIRNGKRRSTCCDAPLVSHGSGDSTCSNCNRQITYGS